MLICPQDRRQRPPETWSHRHPSHPSQPIPRPLTRLRPPTRRCVPDCRIHHTLIFRRIQRSRHTSSHRRVSPSPFFPPWLYDLYLQYAKRDKVYGTEKGVAEFIAKREEGSGFGGGKLDFRLRVPNVLPAVPHGEMKDGWMGCSYPFLFIPPLARLSRWRSSSHIVNSIDPRNAIEEGVYELYDTEWMHGFPVSVLVLVNVWKGKRLLRRRKLFRDF